MARRIVHTSESWCKYNILQDSVLERYTGVVHNLEVAEDHSYVAGGVVVHNCDGFADADTGFGRGVYRPDDAPPIPTHANCRCAYSVIQPAAAQLALMEEIAA